MPSISKPRDTSEVQDLYRRTLAASWYRLPSELPADECIEDIFSGGNGWRTKQDSSTTPDTDEEDFDADSPSSANTGTLRPRDFRKLNLLGLNSGSHSSQHQQHSHHHHHFGHRGHRRSPSGSSDKSVSTVIGKPGASGRRTARSVREEVGSPKDSESIGRSRGSSLVSMTPTLGSEMSGAGGLGGTRRVREREIDEDDARDDLVAWRLPGGLTAA
jgi:hypothetical protein